MILVIMAAHFVEVWKPVLAQRSTPEEEIIDATIDGCAGAGRSGGRPAGELPHTHRITLRTEVRRPVRIS